MKSFSYCLVSLFCSILLSCNSSQQNSGISNISVFNTKQILEKSIFYSVEGIYPNPLDRMTLVNAIKLDDFIQHYPHNWIESYDSVVLIAYKGEEVSKAVSSNDKLTPFQLKILSELDYTSRFEVHVFFQEINVVTKRPESKEMRRSFSIVPQKPAEFPGGREKLIDFLKERAGSSLDLSQVPTIKVGPDSLETDGPTSVFFEINERGEAVKIKIRSTSNIPKTDSLMMKLVADMPLWIPAKDENGKEVVQGFEFLVTLSSFGSGC